VNDYLPYRVPEVYWINSRFPICRAISYNETISSQHNINVLEAIAECFRELPTSAILVLLFGNCGGNWCTKIKSWEQSILEPKRSVQSTLKSLVTVAANLSAFLLTCNNIVLIMLFFDERITIPPCNKRSRLLTSFQGRIDSNNVNVCNRSVMYTERLHLWISQLNPSMRKSFETTRNQTKYEYIEGEIIQKSLCPKVT